MLRRKRRMPFDPPGTRKRRKKPPAPRRTDQIFLSRRMFLVKAGIAAGFTTLAARLGYMQILRGDTYTEAAADNVVRWKERKPTRGIVFDRAGRPLAENRRAWEVRIVPPDLPDVESADWAYVREQLITALRLPEVLIVDPNAVPAGADSIVYSRIAVLLGATTQEEVDATIQRIRRSAKYNYVVQVADELTPDQASNIRAQLQELPGVEVVNQIDYLVRNFGLHRTPVPVKSDVAREVALKLEANRLYLPGVELDDSVMRRRYTGGPTMSHILGYVGVIQEDDLNNEENIARTDADGQVYYRYYQPDDSIGQTGLERQYEKLLRGQKGGSYFEHDAHGVLIRELTGGAPAVNGKNLQLTIDLELQAAVSRAVRLEVERSTAERRAAGQARANCRGGAVVVLSPKTGEVFSLVSYPDYDNQLFIDGLSILKAQEYGLIPDEEKEKARQEAIARNEEILVDGVTDPLTDRAYIGAYEPGSTIKLFMAMAGLREKVIDENKQFTCTGGIGVPNSANLADRNVYLCWKHKDGQSHGQMDVVGAIEQSCDVFFYNVGTPKQPLDDGTNLIYRDYFFANDDLGDRHEFRGLGIDKIDRHLRKRFWFGEPTGIDLPAEAKGLVPTPDWKSDNYPGDGWAAGDTINTSIGQGFLQTSPLQLAVNTAALANNGRVLQPRVVRAVVGDDGKDEIQVLEKKQQRRIKFTGAHLDLVREGMRRVVHAEMGTAHRNGDQSTKWPLTNPKGEEEIIIAGKTGTAEVGAKNPETGESYEAHAWFTCYAPLDDPEVVVTVFLERGGEGSTYAVPVADAALRAYFELTERRNRGLVLRRDGKPIDAESPAPAEAPETNSATPEAVPGE